MNENNRISYPLGRRRAALGHTGQLSRVGRSPAGPIDRAIGRGDGTGRAKSQIDAGIEGFLWRLSDESLALCGLLLTLLALTTFT